MCYNVERYSHEANNATPAYPRQYCADVRDVCHNGIVAAGVHWSSACRGAFGCFALIELSVIGWFIALLVLTGHIAGAVCAFKLFKMRRWLGEPGSLKFWICSGVPSLTAGIILKLIDVTVSGAWYFNSGLLSIISVSLIAYTAVFLAGFGIWLLGERPVGMQKSK